MKTTTNENGTVKAALLHCANNDIRLARKHGELLIAGTKRGNISLMPTPEGGMMLAGSAVDFASGQISTWTIAGRVGFIRETLAGFYRVVSQ